jgi:hypothetical protein
MGQKVSLPDPAPLSTPGEQNKTATGGQLFKFEDDAYKLFHPNVTPELYDANDGGEKPNWILDVRALGFLGFRVKP